MEKYFLYAVLSFFVLQFHSRKKENANQVSLSFFLIQKQKKRKM